MGPRVPMYVISPWSRGGFVDSQVFDHTSVDRFLERRFGITVPAISPWHRALPYVLHVYDRLRLDALPRRYTVEAGKRLEDRWAWDGEGRFDLYVMGPNGFIRHFAGSGTAAEAPPTLVTRYDAAGGRLAIERRAQGRRPAVARLTSEVYAPHRQSDLGERETLSTAQSGGWYDLVVSGRTFNYRYAGRVETGRASTSEPAVATG